MLEAVEGLVTVWSQRKELLVHDKIALLLLERPARDGDGRASTSSSWSIEGLSMPLTTRSGRLCKAYPTRDHWLLVVFTAAWSESVYGGTARLENFSEVRANRAVFSLAGTTPLQEVVLK